MLRFKRKAAIDEARLAVVNRYIIGAVVLTMLPATYMTVNIVRESVKENAILRFVKTSLKLRARKSFHTRLTMKTIR